MFICSSDNYKCPPNYVEIKSYNKYDEILSLYDELKDKNSVSFPIHEIVYKNDNKKTIIRYNLDWNKKTDIYNKVDRLLYSRLFNNLELCIINLDIYKTVKIDLLKTNTKGFEKLKVSTLMSLKASVEYMRKAIRDYFEKSNVKILNKEDLFNKGKEYGFISEYFHILHEWTDKAVGHNIEIENLDFQSVEKELNTFMKNFMNMKIYTNVDDVQNKEDLPQKPFYIDYGYCNSILVSLICFKNYNVKFYYSPSVSSSNIRQFNYDILVSAENLRQTMDKALKKHGIIITGTSKKEQKVESLLELGEISIQDKESIETFLNLRKSASHDSSHIPASFTTEYFEQDKSIVVIKNICNKLLQGIPNDGNNTKPEIELLKLSQIKSR